MYVFESAEDLIYKRLEMGISERLPRPDDSCQVAFHEFWTLLAKGRGIKNREYGPTFIEIGFIEIFWPGNVHII